MLTDLLLPKKYLPKAESARRRAICRACPYLKWSRCTLCGCFVGLKTRLTTETCPKGKWGDTSPLSPRSLP